MSIAFPVILLSVIFTLSVVGAFIAAHFLEGHRIKKQREANIRKWYAETYRPKKKA